jgi:hypothetical protein
MTEVQAIAKCHFPDNIRPWSELFESRPSYTWTEVFNAAGWTPDNASLFLLDNPRPSSVTFSEASLKVLRAFGNIHVGMDGLMFESASFPTNHGFRIVQKTRPGCSQLGVLCDVSSVEGWTANKTQASNPITQKAYWTARCQNNFETLNSTNALVCRFLQGLQGLRHC